MKENERTRKEDLLDKMKEEIKYRRNMEGLAPSGMGYIPNNEDLEYMTDEEIVKKYLELDEHPYGY